MNKKPDEVKKGAPAYMNTYGDMMTLLLCFFVLLFATSSLDEAKFKAFIDSYSGTTGLLEGGEVILAEEGMLGNGIKQQPSNVTQKISKGQELKEIEYNVQKFINDKQLEDVIEVEKKGDAIVITFEDALLFDTGKADLMPAAIPILSKLGNELQQYILNGYQLKCEGHTDNVPIKTIQFPSNWELSSARAIAVAKFFVNELEFPPALVSAEGYGEYNPIADNSSPEGRMKNRRVELRLTKR